MKTGCELIVEERKRQIKMEGWTEDHDDSHKKSELALAGACYAFYAASLNDDIEPSDCEVINLVSFQHWPFDRIWFKPGREDNEPGMASTPQQIRNLVKAGALIAAEIDRLKRKENR